MRKIIFFILLSCLTIPPHAFADAPMPPPAKVTAKSPDGSVTAVSDPATSTTTIRNARTGRVLWRIPGPHRSLFVANDGRHAVTGYEGLNLIPTDSDRKLVLITFWREGVKTREVTLGEVAPGKSILRKTVSHYHWGSIAAIDKKGRLVVLRADDKVLLYDLDTGRRTK